jgi:hypothetical protein
MLVGVADYFFAVLLGSLLVLYFRLSRTRNGGQKKRAIGVQNGIFLIVIWFEVLLPPKLF